MENHYIEIENRHKITVSEVTDVDAFDERTIFADLTDEGLVISGENLHIEILDLEVGKLVASGDIINITYAKKKKKLKLFERFKK